MLCGADQSAKEKCLLILLFFLLILFFVLCICFLCTDCDFACLLYGMLTHKLAQDVLETIVKDAVEIEKAFICDAIPCALIGMNSGMMSTYIEYCADRLLQTLGSRKIYNVQNPFDWMEMISLQGNHSIAHSTCSDNFTTACCKRLRQKLTRASVLC